MTMDVWNPAMMPTLPSRLARRMSSAVRTKRVRSGQCWARSWNFRMAFTPSANFW